MKGAVGLVALGCALGGANAKFLKWSTEYESQRWLPAQQTLGAMLDLRGMSPRPTVGPRLAPAPPSLERRDSTDNTCAYVGGKFSSSLYCDVTDACVYNSRVSYIGCCPESSTTCPIPTVCYDSTDSAKFTTDNGYSIYCGNSKYQHCITHRYATDDPLFSGYTLLGCAVAAGSDTVYYDAKDTSVSSQSLKAGNTGTTATGTNGGGAVTVTVDPTTSSSAPTGGSSSSGGGSSTPVGAIAGGVVGGVAGLALIGVGIWLIVRNANKKKNQPPAGANAVATGNQGPPPPGPPGYNHQQPPMGQYPPTTGYYDPNQQAPGGFAPVHDPRASIAKPPYDTHANSVYQSSYTTSPPGSPPPQSPHTPVGPFNQGNTPPPAGVHYPSGYTASTAPGSPPPPQGQPGFAGQSQATHDGYQHPQGYQYAAELPTQRGDGEVRELA